MSRPILFKVIENRKFPTQGTEIILLSDGESNNPYLHIVPTLKQKGITVHTISVSQQADADMTKLAAETGGKSYTYLETNSVSFADVLSEAISAGTTDAEAMEKVLSYVTRKSTFGNCSNIEDPAKSAHLCNMSRIYHIRHIVMQVS